MWFSEWKTMYTKFCRTFLCSLRDEKYAGRPMDTILTLFAHFTDWVQETLKMFSIQTSAWERIKITSQFDVPSRGHLSRKLVSQPTALVTEPPSPWELEISHSSSFCDVLKGARERSTTEHLAMSLQSATCTGTSPIQVVEL